MIGTYHRAPEGRSVAPDLGIQTCGRYGEWNHLWTDEAFKSGEAAAQAALDGEARVRAA